VEILYQYLLSGVMATKIAALNTRYSSTPLTLLDPASNAYKGVKRLQSIPTYPAIYILASEQIFNAQSTTTGRVKPTIQLGIVERNQDGDTLHVALYRYGLALIELLLTASGDGVTLPGWTIATDQDWVCTFDATSLTDSTGSSWVGEVNLEIQAYAWENQ